MFCFMTIQACQRFFSRACPAASKRGAALGHIHVHRVDESNTTVICNLCFSMCVSGQMTEFQDAVRQFFQWLLPVFDVLDSRDLLTETRRKVISDNIRDHQADVEHARQLASRITNHPVMGDSNHVSDTVSEMERAMEEAERALGARKQEDELRGQRSGRFEELRQEVVRWLTEKEKQTEEFEPVAVDVELTNAQIEQIKVCCVFDSLYFDTLKLTISFE